MLTRRLEALRKTPDAGFGLADLLVSAALMTIVGSLAVTFFVSSSAASNGTADASLGTAQSRSAMAAITALLRLADTPTAQAGYSTDRFTEITASETTFYSNTNVNRSGSGARTAPTKVVLTATATQLVEKLYAPNSPTVPADYTTNYNATPTSTRVLVDGLGSTNVFSYCAQPDAAATSCTTPAVTGTSVAAVTVSLVVNGRRTEKPRTLTSTIGITGALS